MSGLSESEAARAYRATIDDHDQTNHLLMHWRHCLFEGTDAEAEAARGRLVAQILETHDRLRAAVKAGTIRTKLPAPPPPGPALWKPEATTILRVPKESAQRDGTGLRFLRASSEQAYMRQRAELEAGLLARTPEGHRGRVRVFVEGGDEHRWAVVLTLEVRPE